MTRTDIIQLLITIIPTGMIMYFELSSLELADIAGTAFLAAVTAYLLSFLTRPIAEAISGSMT